MGRPIKKIFIGERAGFGSGGEGLASVVVGGVNNSDSFTVADALTIGAPNLVGGVQAEGEVATLKTDGELSEGVTTFTASGLQIDESATYSGVVVDSTAGGSGTGATFDIVNPSGQTDYSNITITILTPGSGYIVGEVLTILGTALGGTTTTNDLELTVATFVTDGTIATLTVSVAGSGYTSIPTVTAVTGGTQGTATLTGALTTGSIPVITASAFRLGGSNLNADIIAQKGNNTYRVTTADGTFEASLTDGAGVAHGTPAAAGEMQIIASDTGDGLYSVTKLYNGHVRLQNISGTPQFSENVKVKWAEDGVAVQDVSVSISA